MMDYLKKISDSERYLSNAREILEKSGRENGYFRDKKYVRIACGAAYLAAQMAADAFLAKHGKKVPDKKGRRHVDNYRELFGQMNKKILNSFNTAYNILHIVGYYEGELNAKIIRTGFEALEEIIDASKK